MAPARMMEKSPQSGEDRTGGAVTDADRRRLRWRCRRGLLENDLVLQRFLVRYGDRLDRLRLDALNELLTLRAPGGPPLRNRGVAARLLVHRPGGPAAAATPA